MTPVFDPLWPWSALLALLSPAGLLVVGLSLGAGIVSYWLPRKGTARRRRLRALGVAGGMLLVWLALGMGGATGGLRGRAVDLGAAALMLSPLVLATLTVWTYLGVPGASRRRVGTVLALRLLAFVLVLLALLRPSLGLADKSQPPGVLFIVADYSASMTIADEADSKTRWAALVRHLRDAGPVIRRLRDEGNVEVVFHKFAGDTVPLDPDAPGEATGPRTDVGAMLRQLFEARDSRRSARGLLILSDGADNGSTRTPALSEAARWRALPCPVHTFAYGKTTTNDRQSDVVLTAIAPEPSPVPVKGELTVKASIDAFGFQNRLVRVKLLLDGKEVAATNATLTLTTGNEVRIKATAPAQPGEVKLTVRVEDPNREGQVLDGEVSAANNEMTTYLTVSKEGISVLLVDKPRAWEPQLICDALARDPRVHLYPVWLRGEQVAANAADLFRFDRQQYDVVVLGDITARQLRAVSPDALATLEKLVNKGAGLLMLGGYSSFGNGDWQDTVLKDLLPVELKPLGQDERAVKMTPTEAGLRKFSYLLRLSDTVKEPAEAWEVLHPLAGMTRLGKPKEGVGDVLAVNGNGGDALFVAGQYGAGRTLAFGGDTTHRWVRDEKTQEMHARFWRQIVVWLAKQEDAQGSVWVKPDARRLPARSDLGFAVGIRGKGGVDLADGAFKAEVIAPDGAKTEVAIARTVDGFRGTFGRTDGPGEYRIMVKGNGKEPGGVPVSGEAAARFLIYDEDVELTTRAANHDLLKKLATAGGGQMHRGEELRTILEEMLRRPLASDKPKLTLMPDWRTIERSPFLMAFFTLFVAILSVEWLLRRKWGLA